MNTKRKEFYTIEVSIDSLMYSLIFMLFGCLMKINQTLSIRKNPCVIKKIYFHLTEQITDKWKNIKCEMYG